MKLCFPFLLLVGAVFLPLSVGVVLLSFFSPFVCCFLLLVFVVAGGAFPSTTFWMVLRASLVVWSGAAVSPRWCCRSAPPLGWGSSLPSSLLPRPASPSSPPWVVLFGSFRTFLIAAPFAKTLFSDSSLLRVLLPSCGGGRWRCCHRLLSCGGPAVWNMQSKCYGLNDTCAVEKTCTD